MRRGIHNVRFDFPGGPASIAFSLMDHWFQVDRLAPATDPTREGCTSLGFLAAHTDTTRLGLLVTDDEVAPCGDPVAFVERVGKEIVPRLADLDPAAGGAG